MKINIKNEVKEDNQDLGREKEIKNNVVIKLGWGRATTIDPMRRQGGEARTGRKDRGEDEPWGKGKRETKDTGNRKKGKEGKLKQRWRKTERKMGKQ